MDHYERFVNANDAAKQKVVPSEKRRACIQIRSFSGTLRQSYCKRDILSTVE